MAKRKTKPHGDPAAAVNPVAEDNGAETAIEPGAAASLDSDDGPLPEDLDEGDEGDDEEDAPPPPPPPPPPAETPPPAPKGAKPKGSKVAISAEVKPAADPRAELRKRLGEPEPHPGAVVDPQTGRVETPPPGWNPKRRPPQKP